MKLSSSGHTKKKLVRPRDRLETKGKLSVSLTTLTAQSLTCCYETERLKVFIFLYKKISVRGKKNPVVNKRFGLNSLTVSKLFNPL